VARVGRYHRKALRQRRGVSGSGTQRACRWNNRAVAAAVELMHEASVPVGWQGQFKAKRVVAGIAAGAFGGDAAQAALIDRAFFTRSDHRHVGQAHVR